MMSEAELTAIDDWRFANRVATRSDAVRRLAQMGIIFDREIRPAVDMVIEHIRASHAGEKPKLTPEQYERMFQDMAISLFNAGTSFSKLGTDISTDEAIKSLTDLYEYYAKHK